MQGAKSWVLFRLNPAGRPAKFRVSGLQNSTQKQFYIGYSLEIFKILEIFQAYGRGFKTLSPNTLWYWALWDEGRIVIMFGNFILWSFRGVVIINLGYDAELHRQTTSTNNVNKRSSQPTPKKLNKKHQQTTSANDFNEQRRGTTLTNNVNNQCHQTLFTNNVNKQSQQTRPRKTSTNHVDKQRHNWSKQATSSSIVNKQRQQTTSTTSISNVNKQHQQASSTNNVNKQRQ